MLMRVCMGDENGVYICKIGICEFYISVFVLEHHFNISKS